MFVSVLEAAATKRDTKNYLKTYASTLRKTSRPRSHEAQKAVEPGADGSGDASDAIGTASSIQEALNIEDSSPHVAIVKLRDVESYDEQTLLGVAKTLTQMRGLGLQQIVVVEAAAQADAASLPPNWLSHLMKQVTRVAGAVDRFGDPGTKITNSVLSVDARVPPSMSPLVSRGMRVDSDEGLMLPLKRGEIPILPSVANDVETQRAKPVPATDFVLALTRKLSGLQFQQSSVVGLPGHDEEPRPSKTAYVQRIIVLDPLGGIPNRARPGSAHVFLNLEQEFDLLRKELLASAEDPASGSATSARHHLDNLELARNCLALLPSTSSVVITTPQEAANNRVSRSPPESDPSTSFVGSVGTRTRKNPLIHNLLTDRSIYSSSLPIARVPPASANSPVGPKGTPTTLAKRGVPVTIYPDPQKTGPWQPPKPGDPPLLRLTDNCVDLPRLVHLIDDSFGRRLDVRHYLERVNDSIAGIIIAGEYEGGAILTWETPYGMSVDEARAQGRIVPYLDKFAVLRRSQGAGGVADVVFNAIVRTCFPDGVCWRSRRNNPVNRWYFERAVGTWKLRDSNWTMFWTTPGVDTDETLLRDYEGVCRNVPPSWADKKDVVD